jgi:hypothetical protein
MASTYHISLFSVIETSNTMPWPAPTASPRLGRYRTVPSHNSKFSRHACGHLEVNRRQPKAVDGPQTRYSKRRRTPRRDIGDR